MKIRFAKAIVAFLSFNLLSVASFSQEASSPGVSTETSTSASFCSGNTNASQYKITASEVTSKAIKTFGDYFTDVADVIWWRQGKEYMAEFRKDGKWVKAYFTAKGNFISSFAITAEDHLPEDIRNQIKTGYHRYNIGTVTEVFINNTTTWFVNLEDDKRVMQVRVADGQIEEIYNRKKSE